MKHELIEVEATPGLVIFMADLFLQISYLKMFGWNLSNCLALTSDSDQHGYPSFTQNR